MEEFNKYGRILAIVGGIIFFIVVGGIKGCAQQSIRENAINNAIEEYENQ
jgi:hypothetical protein